MLVVQNDRIGARSRRGGIDGNRSHGLAGSLDLAGGHQLAQYGSAVHIFILFVDGIVESGNETVIGGTRYHVDGGRSADRGVRGA